MGERGPKQTPPALQLLRGDPRQRGKAALAASLEEQIRPPVAIPACPVHLRDEARAEWDRITPHLQRLGLITEIDLAALAAYCTAWGEYVWAEERIAKHTEQDATGERGRIWDTPSGYKQMSPLVQIRNRALEMMAKFLAEFGMTPAARSRVTRSDPQLGLPGMDQKPGEGGWGTFS